MSKGMHRMSEIPGWVPLKVFADDAEFTVRAVPHPDPDAGDASDASETIAAND